MNFQLSEEQQMLQASARQIAQQYIEPVVQSHDRNRPLPKEAMLGIFQIFAKEGLTAPRLPIAIGGSGMRMLDYGLVFEQLPPVIANSLISHEVTVARIGLESEEQQRRRFQLSLPAVRYVVPGQPSPISVPIRAA